MLKSERVGWDVSLGGLPSVERVIRAGRGHDLHLGAQLFVSLAGDPVADVAIGEARPGSPLRTTDLMPWTCVSKPITSALVANAWERGELDLDAPVAQHVPEFAAHGKHEITLRHLLTHSSGLAGDPASLVFARPWPEVIKWVCNLKPLPRREPGRVFTYVRESAWFMLAEILRRTLGIDDYPAYVRGRVFEALGMEDCWLAMPQERFRAYGNAIVPVQGMSGSGPMPYLCPQNDPFLAPRCSPGETGRGPMRELARFYESLLGLGGRPPLVDPETAREVTRPREVDRRQRVDWGLGFKADRFSFRANHPLYPEQAFGHDGLDSFLALGDWRHDLVVTVAFNGQPRRAGARGSPGLLRQQLFVAALYRDLGLSLFDEVGPARIPYLDQRLERFAATARAPQG